MMLDNVTLKRKLAAINLSVTAAAMILIGGAVLFDQYRVMKQEIFDDLRTQARIIADYSTAALQFDDRQMAKEIIGALRASPNIHYAVMLDQHGAPFAEYRRSETTAHPDGPGAADISKHDILEEPVSLKGETIGLIRFDLDMLSLRDFLFRQIAMVMAILVAVFGVVWLTLDKLHGLITKPLLELAGLMRLVSESKAYSIRAKPTTRDEVGALGQGFNEMLDQIHRRDQELEEHKLGLERLVGQRTAQLEHMANHDALTGLPNRQLFTDRLAQALYQAERTGTIVALLFIDLDHFKEINDTLGHAAGDQLLREFSKRQLGTIRKGDTLARFGGDEFAVILVGVMQASDVEPEISRLLAAIAKPVQIGGTEIRMTASLGISLYPQDGDNGELLLRNADTAMYRAKELGRNDYQFYTEELNVRLVERLTLLAELRRAIAEGQFVLYYQPQVDLTSGQIVGMEALIRWQHPERGLTSPGDFIALAEETGLIVAIGSWVLHEACRQTFAWHNSGLTSIRVAVNLSVAQFRHGEIVDKVAEVLASTGLPAKYLELELTESILLEDTDATMEMLQRLKAMGVSLSIDDFGTGYSSLSYLKHLAVDKLKIDQSFVRDMVEDPEAAAIVKAVIQLGHTLQLDLIAEGVETEGQLAFLRQSGCDEMQGYLFSRPLPVEDFEALLREGRFLPMPKSEDDGHRTILLVDDEESILNALWRDLRQEGYKVLRAVSGDQALEMLASNVVAVILADQRMPIMNGTELLRRAKDMHPNAVRMVLTGYAELDSITGAINEGAIYKFLSKPWDSDQLRAVIKDAFRHYDLIREHERALRSFYESRDNVRPSALV
ncbi:MAG: EAL domain-containing protein [Dechloromonas sp.]|uniref:EAL domain-containing protein n=1 Tax=Dechloromonas sp. TaxID=1917218 RepID=UPI0027ECDB26|nr:EAL domain-containing protein [Dechloromonas sp.]MBT9520427.1 EAL domain-containing protein [Dechloromonas sp.]